MRIDDRVIEEIKNKANIVDVISRYINVIKKGNNYLAVCPFHNDSNPSMNISESKQIYKCFSCGAGGNVFTFVSEYEKVGFLEAVRKVANIVGYDLSEYEIETPKVDTKKERLLKLVKDAMEFYNYNLLNSDNDGLTYLTTRGMNIDVIDNFKLGYAPSDSSKTLRYLTKKGYTVEEIVEAGIGINNGGFLDRFASRVVFPISDLNGNVVAFSGRRIDDSKTSKYINSNENILFNKSECLYNFYEAKNYILQTKKIYIVEGFMDTIALYKSNIKNVVATMGVNLSSKHIKAIERLNAEVIFSLDSDEAGQSSMFKLVESLKETNLIVRVTNISENGKDLDEIYNLKGEKGVSEFVNNTMTIPEFKVSYKLKRTNLSNYIERSNLIKYVADLAKKEIPNKIERENFIIMASKKIGCDKSLISENVDNLTRKVVKSLSDIEAKKNNNDRYYLAEIEIIKQMLYNKDATYYYITNLGYLLDNTHRNIATYIVNYYYSQNDWDGKKILESIQERDIKEAASKIFNDDGLAKNFEKSVFDVIKVQMPLEIELKELKKQFGETDDLREKAIISSRIGEIKQKLKNSKNASKEDN